MKPHILQTETYIARPLQEVFTFFSDARNLQRITPPQLHFNILTPGPIDIQEGTLIDYQLKLYGIPFYWKTRITEWKPPYKFADQQIKGPYQLWYHEHFFEEKNGQTRMVDKVSYRSPGGLLEFIPHQLFVKRNVEQIFAYRTQQLELLFP